MRYGRVTRDDVVGKGNWPELVDESTFWAAQAVLDAPGRAPGRKSVRKHLLTGVLGCGKCGGHLSGAYVGKTSKASSPTFARAAMESTFAPSMSSHCC